MKNEKLFNETVDILVKAYLNDTLKHEDCTACAVGNIVAAKHKGKTNKDWFELSPLNHIRGLHDRNEAAKQILATGYTQDEIFRIEAAFEFAPKNLERKDKDGFFGLMAVVDVLCEIHECEEIKEETKKLFVK